MATFRIGLGLAGLLGVVAVVAACGSGSKSPATTTAQPLVTVPIAAAPKAGGKPLTTRTTPAPPRRTGSPRAPAQPHSAASKPLHVALAATVSPAGSGEATIRIFTGPGEVCWSFGKLSGISNPASAAIGIGDVGGGAVEFSLGSRYSPTGCVAPSIARGALQSIVTTPGDFFVQISAGRGAAIVPRLRGQLAAGRPVSLAPSG